MSLKDCKNKKRKIIDVAQKLFAQYGFEKTTMQDIANSLEISKATLYYYFPDKEALYRFIIEQEKEECLCEVRKSIKDCSTAKEMLHLYAVERFDMTERLVNLSRMKSLYQQNMQTFMTDAIKDFQEHEEVLIREILDIGVEQHEFAIDNINETAHLINDLIRGLRMLYLRSRISLTSEEKKSHFRQLHLFIDIFCKGLEDKKQ